MSCWLKGVLKSLMETSEAARFFPSPPLQFIQLSPEGVQLLMQSIQARFTPSPEEHKTLPFSSFLLVFLLCRLDGILYSSPRRLVWSTQKYYLMGAPTERPVT
jgi:hypothetical protein